MKDISPPVGHVQLGVLGYFSLRIDTAPVYLPMNAQRLVSYLALHDGKVLRQHVAGSLWGDRSDHHAAGSLRSALWRLGHSTAPLVEAENAHLFLSPTVAVDLHAGEALAHRILGQGNDLDESDLDEGLLAENVLPDWTEDWVLVKREHYAQLRLRALETLCWRLGEMGRFGQAVQAGLLAVAAEPLRESAQRVLIAVHLAEGNVAAGLKQYEAFCTLLRTELGLTPSPKMQALIKGVKR